MRWSLPIKNQKHSLFFQPGGEGLHCLDSAQALILEALKSGYDVQEICNHLKNTSEEGLLEHVEGLQQHWQSTGLLDSPASDLGGIYPHHTHLVLGLSQIVLYTDSPELQRRLNELFPPQGPNGTPDHIIEVSEGSTEMQVLVDGVPKHKCRDFDQLLITCLFEMGELATHEFPRLFVAHAAAVRNESQVLLMPGHAGQGKSTLTAGLIKKGYQLINDDIVPINFDGSLVAINSPLKIKSGSWSVLSNLYPELDEIKPVMRADDQIMKLVPQAEHSCTAGSTHMPTAIIIPEYSPNCEPELIQLEKGEGLSSILLTEPFLPHRLSRQYLQAIADWQAELPVWRVRYKHTDEAAQLLASLPV